MKINEPPKGLGTVNDQGRSATCVRSSLSKAVASDVFLNHKIDIDETHIMVCLVQERKELFDPMAPTNPMKFDKTVLYLQDKANDIPGLQNQRCWWKVRNQKISTFYAFYVNILTPL